MAKHGAKGRRARLIAPAALLIACALGWDAIRPMLADGSEPVYARYSVEAGDVETEMSLSGTVELKKSETLSAPARGNVREVCVEAGQSVSAGDVILRMDDGEEIAAGIDGSVASLSVAAGDPVRPQMALAVIADLDALQVCASVDEYDVESIAAGQACSVTVVPLGITFDAEIGHVDRVSASTGAVASYTVTADIDAPEGVLPGMRASVSLPRARAEDVARLPMAALSFDSEGAPYVLMEDGAGGYAQVAVETGLSDGMYVEIVSGVEIGDEAYVQTGARSVERRLSPQNIYRAIFGETTVVNDHTGGTRGGFAPGALSGAELPEGFAPPEGAGAPEDAELSENARAFESAGAADASEGAPEDAELQENARAGGGAPFGGAGAENGQRAAREALAADGGAAKGVSDDAQ